MTLAWVAAILVGAAAIVWGAERFAEHLAVAAVAMGVSSFALALLLAGAEPEELATTVTATARGAPGVAFGDVVGSNIAICLVALGVGAIVAPLPFGSRVGRYARLGLPIAVVASAFVWDGRVDRPEGAVLVVLYVAYVTSIWVRERRPPTLGETIELDEAEAHPIARRRFGRELGNVLLGLAALIAGAVLLVEAVRHLSGAEETQTVLGLTLIGFATAFELVVLAWSTARRGASEAAIAAIVGSLTYNVTMTLGVAALVHPLVIVDAHRLRPSVLAMLGAFALVTFLGARGSSLDRREGIAMLALYPAFLVLATWG